ncbi:MAG: MerR family transcriptional regulator [Firmicutes bacterium]|nr:MerR family transcriptional regulator [Bacillota bacterium]
MKKIREKTKSEKKLLSIKEFSEMSSLEQSTLRYWDDIGLFRPAYRNTENGYRYYSPEQIILINFIKVLSNLHVPLKTIADVSENRSPEAILRLMEQQEELLDAQLSRLHASYSTIHTLRDILRQGISIPDEQDISVQNLEAMPIVLGPQNGEEQSFYQSFVRYCQYAKENRINLNNPIGGYFESLERFLQTPSVPSRFFSVDPRGHDTRAAGRYIVGYAKGYYSQLEEAAPRLDEFAAQQGLAPQGPVYVIYLRDEISEKNTDNYLAQVCVAL